MNNISFEGFEVPKPKQEKDLPPRPLPQPIPTEPSKTWSPEVPKEVSTESDSKKIIVNMVNIMLPIAGLTIILGGMIGIIIFVTQYFL